MYMSGAVVTTAVIIPSDVCLRQYSDVLMSQHLIICIKMRCSACDGTYLNRVCSLSWCVCVCVCVQGHCEADGAVCGS